MNEKERKEQAANEARREKLQEGAKDFAKRFEEIMRDLANG